MGNWEVRMGSALAGNYSIGGIVTAYPWYCPECGREEYGLDDDEEPKACSSCGADMCKLEPESEDGSDLQKGEK